MSELQPDVKVYFAVIHNPAIDIFGETDPDNDYYNRQQRSLDDSTTAPVVVRKMFRGSTIR
jgi:hypothetical protein